MNMLMLIVKEKLFKLKWSSLMRYMQTLTNFPQITHVCQTYVLCMCYYDSKRAGLLPPRFITDTLWNVESSNVYRDCLWFRYQKTHPITHISSHTAANYVLLSCGACVACVACVAGWHGTQRQPLRRAAPRLIVYAVQLTLIELPFEIPFYFVKWNVWDVGVNHFLTNNFEANCCQRGASPR